MAQLNQTLTQPVTPRDANGIARITPKSDRGAVKVAYATWNANWKAYTYAGGSDPGKFDYAGLTYSDEGGGFSGTTFIVTVNAGKYLIGGVSQATVTLNEGSSYRFDQSHSSNGGHPLKLSTTSNGTHGGGSEYTTGVTYNGTPGQAGAYTQITVAVGAPTLYYYCQYHSGMGGQANTP
tara:strand:+ start:359 stop:895 length:537 start_codon:yes stop_codon:yes gene_type:complete